MTKLLLAFFLSASFTFCAPINKETVQSCLNRMQSQGWNDREHAFYDMVNAGLSSQSTSSFRVADAVLAIAHKSEDLRAKEVSALNELLSTESTLISSGGAPQAEEYYVYHGDLIQAIATLRDPSSTVALLQAINTGNMATNALAGFGENALSGALNKINSADQETRLSIYHMLTAMTEKRNYKMLQSEAAQRSLLDALLSGADDIEPSVRRTVVTGLAHLSTPESLGALRKLADSDSFSKIVGSETRYPVREAARQALTSSNSTVK